MAHKKKKKKVKNNKQRAQRQQKKQQRRAKRTGEYTPANAARESGNSNEIIEDALALFPHKGTGNPNPEAVLEYLFFQAADTAHLISEREFDDVGFDPLRTPELFAEASEKLSLGDMESKSEEEQSDTFISILDEIMDDLLADGTDEEILNAADSLRIRLKKSKRRREDVTRLAALHMLLTSENDDKPDSAWSVMGLVQAMVQRSIGVGIEIMDVMSELPGDPEMFKRLMDDSDSLFNDEGPFQKIVSRIEKSPLLERFMTNKQDDIWEEGLDALYAGQLVLNIYEEDELNRAERIFRSAQFDVFKQMGFEPKLDVDSELDDETERKFDLFLDGIDTDKALKKAAQTFIPQFIVLAQNTFRTEDRSAKLLSQLERLTTEHISAKSGWGTFLLQAKDLLDDEPDEFFDSGFALRAIMGELKPMVTKDSADDDLAD